MNAAHRGMLGMTAFVVLWAAIEALAAGVLQAYSPFQVVWTRYAVHLLVLVAIWPVIGGPAPWRTSRPLYQFGRSLLMLGMPASWVFAMHAGVPGDTIMLLFWVSPLLILGLAWLLLREAPPPTAWAAAALGLAGAALLHGHHSLSAGELPLPLLMALSFSLYVVMTRALRDQPLASNLFHSALGVFLVLTLAMPALWHWPSWRDLLVMCSVGVLGLLALALLDRAAAAAPLAMSAPVAYLQLPVFLALGAATGLVAFVSPRRSAAGMLLIVGVAAVWWWLARRTEPAGLAPTRLSKES